MNAPTYLKVQSLVEQGLLQMDLVVASSRSISTAFSQALTTIADYDIYLHEGLRINSKNNLNPEDVTINGIFARCYDYYDHILSVYRATTSTRAVLPDNPVRILAKEMATGENYATDLGFRTRYEQNLQELLYLSTNVIVLRRNAQERLASFAKLNKSDDVPEDDRLTTDQARTLIEQEDRALEAIQRSHGKALFVDTSRHFAFRENTGFFFDTIIRLLKIPRIPNTTIEKFDLVRVNHDLVNIDTWAARSFNEHKGLNL